MRAASVECQRQIAALCNARAGIKFNRTCAAKYPQQRGIKSKPPTLPASACANSPAHEPRSRHRARTLETRRMDPQIAQAKVIERPELARELAKPDAINAISRVLDCRSAGNAIRCAWPASQRVSCRISNQWRRQDSRNARKFEQFDRVARRNFGLDLHPPGGCPVNLAILTNQAAVRLPHLNRTGRELPCVAVIGSCSRLHSKAVDCNRAVLIWEGMLAKSGQANSEAGAIIGHLRWRAREDSNLKPSDP